MDVLIPLKKQYLFQKEKHLNVNFKETSVIKQVKDVFKRQRNSNIHSCSIKAWFLIIDLQWFFQCTQKVKIFNVFSLRLFQGTTLRECFQQMFMTKKYKPFSLQHLVETISFFFCYSICFNLIKTATKLMYSLKESLFIMLFR